MFLKNEIGEIVNVDKIIAVRAFEGGPAYDVCLHTESGHRIHFQSETKDRFHEQHRTIQEILIRGPKHSQQPWSNSNTKWVCTNGTMLRLDQIECILVEGWVVTVHMTNDEIQFLTHSDDELEKCLNNFEFNLRCVGQYINLTGWKAEN